MITAARRPLSGAPDVCRMGVAALAEGFRSGSLSPVEVAEAALGHAEAVQGTFNAFTLIDGDGAIEAARASEARWRAGTPLSPVDGVPTTLKDVVHVQDWPARYGSLTTSDEDVARDAPAVGALRAAGAVFLGQTTTPEFGWKAVTDSRAFGVTRNPWDPDLSPGGSSGGAAVAAACGAGVLHLGTDGGGSIRIPAAFTGTVGMKPTFGRVPAAPPSAFGTVAHLGPMARTVADARAMLTVMSRRDLQDWHQPWGDMPPLGAKPFDWEGKRVGYWQTPPVGTVDREVAAQVSRAVALLVDAGAEVVPVDLPTADHLEVFHAHWLTGAANRLAMVPVALRSEVDPGFAEAAAAGAERSVIDYIRAQVARAAFGAAMDRLLAEFDLVVSPAVAVLPFGAGREVPEGSGLARWTEWAGFSWPINLSQQPACAVPCGAVRGLPVGLQIVGPRGSDGVVLDAAEACEGLLGGGP